MRKVIVNTTPIIALADIGYLDLLKKLYGEILIPEAYWLRLSASRRIRLLENLTGSRPKRLLCRIRRIASAHVCTPAR